MFLIRRHNITWLGILCCQNEFAVGSDKFAVGSDTIPLIRKVLSNNRSDETFADWSSNKLICYCQ